MSTLTYTHTNTHPPTYTHTHKCVRGCSCVSAGVSVCECLREFVFACACQQVRLFGWPLFYIIPWDQSSTHTHTPTHTLAFTISLTIFLNFMHSGTFSRRKALPYHCCSIYMSQQRLKWRTCRHQLVSVQKK